MQVRDSCAKICLAPVIRAGRRAARVLSLSSSLAPRTALGRLAAQAAPLLRPRLERPEPSGGRLPLGSAPPIVARRRGREPRTTILAVFWRPGRARGQQHNRALAAAGPSSPARCEHGEGAHDNRRR